jgi:hypothetical protein
MLFPIMRVWLPLVSSVRGFVLFGLLKNLEITLIMGSVWAVVVVKYYKNKIQIFYRVFILSCYCGWPRRGGLLGSCAG